MHVDVPYHEPEGVNDCGPTALRMAMSYLGEDPGIEAIEKHLDRPEGHGVFTVQLAAAAAEMGYETDFYTRKALFRLSDLNHKWKRNFRKMEADTPADLVARAEEAGVNIVERSYSTREDVLSAVTETSLPVVQLYWGVISERGGGHFVPVVGYDDDAAYVHNPMTYNSEKAHPLKESPIPIDTFEEARKAEGTDEEYLVLHG